jgi:hypothetical protein
MLDTVYTRRGIRQISSDEVRAETGLDWFDWQVALDSWEGDGKQLLAAVAYLKEKYGLNHHWAQIVATYYLLERLA